MTTEQDNYDGQWHLSQEAMSGFMSILSSSVALCALPPHDAEAEHPEVFLAMIRRCQDTLETELECLTIEDEKQIHTLVELFHQSVRSATSTFTPTPD